MEWMTVQISHMTMKQQYLSRNLKKIINEVLAMFVPCANHSFDWIGIHMAHLNVQGVMGHFFSCSTHKWSFKQFVDSSVKLHCDTKWSSKADAVKANIEKN